VTPNYRREDVEADASRVPFKPYEEANTPPGRFASNINPHQAASHGIAQTFGVHPMGAFGIVGADMMLHSADVMSAGLLMPFSALAAVVLAFIVYRMQRAWYGDDHNSALIKCALVFLLTLIPSPLPYALFIPAGIIGLFRRKA
jgi:hypothetical protein